MLKKTITYTDYNGESVTEDFYFNLSKAELLELNVSKKGGYQKWADNIMRAKDEQTLYREIKRIILSAYGIKSDDGRRFIKSKDIRDDFEQTEAFSELLMELATNAEAASNFMKGVLPPDVLAQAEAQQNKMNHPALKG